LAKLLDLPHPLLIMRRCHGAEALPFFLVHVLISWSRSFLASSFAHALHRARASFAIILEHVKYN
jgi:hypothetical protein